MTERDLIQRILKDPSLTIKTRNFIEDLSKRLDRFSKLTDAQIDAVKKIASQLGVQIQETTAIRDIVEPTINEIKEIKGSCGDCRDGLIFALNTIDENQYVFLCDCKFGNLRSERYPRWFNSINEFEKAPRV